jgi:hypothetical protein
VHDPAEYEVLVLQLSRYIVTLVEQGTLGQDGVLEAKDLEVEVKVNADGSWVVRLSVDDEESEDEEEEDGEGEGKKKETENEKEGKVTTKDPITQKATTDHQATLAIWAETQNLRVKFNDEEIWRREVSTEVKKKRR